MTDNNKENNGSYSGDLRRSKYSIYIDNSEKTSYSYNNSSSNDIKRNEEVKNNSQISNLNSPKLNEPQNGNDQTKNSNLKNTIYNSNFNYSSNEKERLNNIKYNYMKYVSIPQENKYSIYAIESFKVFTNVGLILYIFFNFKISNTVWKNTKMILLYFTGSTIFNGTIDILMMRFYETSFINKYNGMSFEVIEKDVKNLKISTPKFH